MSVTPDGCTTAAWWPASVPYGTGAGLAERLRKLSKNLRFPPGQLGSAEAGSALLAGREDLL